MPRCLIVDDEAPARQRLRRLLSAIKDVSIVGEAENGVSALEQVAAQKPDVILLDIEMPELDGLGVAAALPADGPAIVFVTAYDEHALRAFELSAVDYVVKPVAADRLEAALKKAASRSGKQATQSSALLEQLPPGRALSRMAVRCGARFIVFDPARVSAILAKDHYSAILVEGKELLADDPLDVLARRLDAQKFMRVHRSAIINLTFLRELRNEGDRRYVAVLSEGDVSVPVSRERLPALKAALGIE